MLIAALAMASALLISNLFGGAISNLVATVLYGVADDDR